MPLLQDVMNSKHQGEYEIERLDESRISDLEKLHAAVYNKKSLSSYFAKKYNTAYTGISYIGYIAYKEKLPIAFYGVIPCFIQYENRVILSAQSADTMTHPEHRYKNLFVNLASMCLELCKQNNIKLVFGFPNQNSYHGFIKLGWKITEIMDCFIIPVKAAFWGDLCSKFSLSRWLYNRYIKVVLNKYVQTKTGLPNLLMSEEYAGVCRSQEYLRYKTYSHTQVILLNGSKLWINIKNGITIGDMEVKEDTFNDVINTLKKLSKKLGVKQIYFHACKHTYMHNLFVKQYSAIPSFPIIFHDFDSGLTLEKIKFTFADIDIF